MSKLLLTAFTLVLLIAGTTAVVAATKDPTTTTTPATTVEDISTTTTPATTVEDISGPCDEAEHAADPRCAGVAGTVAGDDDLGEDAVDGHGRGRDHPEDDGVVDDDDEAGLGEDISGPCDEAEHFGDPECAGVSTGVAVADGDDDNSGPSANSGPGSVSSGSGHSFDDDDGFDDDGGSGDSSGPGG